MSEFLNIILFLLIFSGLIVFALILSKMYHKKYDEDYSNNGYETGLGW
jgi:NADH:ubiquinone oxidoreductase subunit 3 (subunit A)